jgi:hypothetical protein
MQAGNHLGQVPADLRLRSFVSERQQFSLERRQQRRPFCGYFLGRVGRAHADNGIAVPKALDKFREPVRLAQDECGDAVRVSNRPAVSAL